MSLWLVVAAAACTSGPSPSDDDVYVKALAAAREIKDKTFREASDSPIPKDKRERILPLKYFPIDPAYSVPASLKLADKRPAFDMPTSSGALRKMELVGTLDFTLQGEKHSLGAFVPAGTGQITSLFIPFADMTTGMETYAAGRYLDIDPTTTGYYMIDFNRAYNPYCAYNASYECPYPPLSNRMKVAIRVGEKDARRMTGALQAIIFDFDGVIANSEPLHYNAFQQTLAEEGLLFTKEEYYSRYLGFDDVGLFQALARDRKLTWSDGHITTLVAQKGAKLQELLRGGHIVFPGALDFIRTAAASVPIAIASGALRHEIAEIIDGAGVASLFSTIVAAGDTPQSKPSPAPYLLAFEQLRRSSGRPLEADRCVAIEDSRWGLESARSAGLRCVGVTHSYSADGLPGAELLVRTIKDLTLGDLDELCSHPVR